MGSLSNILRLVRRAGEEAEKMAKKQLSVRRKGNRFPMNTYGLLSDSIEFKLKAKGHLANLTLESFEEGLLLRVCIFMHVGSICFINVRRYK